MLEGRERHLPKLADAEQVGVVEALAHLLDELGDEALVDVLDGVKAEPCRARLLHDPHAPVDQVLAHVRVRVVNVGTHQVVVVALLLVDRLGPRLALALDLEDAVLLVLVVVVDASLRRGKGKRRNEVRT